MAASGGLGLRNLTLSYDRHPAVHHLSGSFAAGSLTAVVGPNGAGKSTLLKALAGIVRPDAGTVDRGGIHPRDIAYLPQHGTLDRSFPISGLDAVLLGHWRRAGIFRRMRADLLERAHVAIDAVGLAGFESRPVGSLSAGQFQRILFARMLVQDAPVILLDEPFAAMDPGTVADLVALVRRWHGERRTVVAVLHDLDQVERHFPETLFLARRCIGWGRTAEVLTAANRLAARAMAERWEDGAPVCGRDAA